jgi:IPT/TIG domain
MSVTNADGATLSETALNALTANPPTTAPPLRVITEDVYQRYSYDHTGRFESGSRLLFHAGQTVSQAAIDALFADATVDTVSPATGPAAGGTDITITGTNLGGVLGVTVGGVAATMVKSVSETTITCRTPAHATGAVSVVVADDSGTAAKANGFTFA